MSRVIKFRAWDKEVNRMVGVDSIEFVDVLEGRCGVNVFSFEEDVRKGKMKMHESRWLDKGKFELLQWTGMKDKNGKEIYEGDIVRYWGGVAPIEYNMFGFAIKYSGDEYFDINEPDRIEVIGNIYENSDLIN